MKKVIAIIFAVLFLCSITELHELLKTPALVAHYLEHKTQDCNLTLFQFLAIHYNTAEAAPDSDNDRDSQLPFKAIQNLSSSIIVFLSTLDIKLPALYLIQEQRSCFNEKAFLSFQLLANIWQPPKY